MNSTCYIWRRGCFEQARGAQNETCNAGSWGPVFASCTCLRGGRTRCEDRQTCRWLDARSEACRPLQPIRARHPAVDVRSPRAARKYPSARGDPAAREPRKVTRPSRPPPHQACASQLAQYPVRPTKRNVGYLPIEEYGIIGDLGTVALVG